MHGVFDIHKYGTRILHSFVSKRKKKGAKASETADIEEETVSEEDVSVDTLDAETGKIVPFRNIASGRPAYDISRLFLATLQLVRS